MHRYLLYHKRIKVDIMGRIRGKQIKNIAKKLVELYPEKFGKKFDDNKKFLDELNLMTGKLTRNKVAGYIVDVVGKKKAK
jgi:small subunit ribosomal protein S17e